MSIFDAIILGIVEGITEFLPISSTGHLMLAGKLLGLPQTEFLKTFDISIQLGAILAVIVLYGRSLLLNIEIIKRVAAAFIPTAVIGLVLYKFIKEVLLDSYEVVLWSLLIGGVIIIVFDLFHREHPEAKSEITAISLKTAALIGLFQSLAVVPGVSRAAATIIGGLLLGINRKTIVEFSFLLAVPTMLAATGLDLLKNADAFSPSMFGVLGIGFVTSFVVALASIKFLLHFIKNHNFIPFGIYRILAAVLFWKLM